MSSCDVQSCLSAVGGELHSSAANSAHMLPQQQILWITLGSKMKRNWSAGTNRTRSNSKTCIEKADEEAKQV